MKMPGHHMSQSAKSAWSAQLFLLPFYLGLWFFFLSPLIQSLNISLSNVSVSLGGYQFKFIGIENYHTALLVDANFTTNLFTTLLDLLWKMPVIVFLGLFMAMILNQKFKGRIFVRAIFFLPVIFASGVVLSIVQNDGLASMALSGASVKGGVISQSTALGDLLIKSGFAKQIVSIATQISDNLFALVWRSGIQMIMFLAGLQSIPISLYEASSIEGASGWENFWKITLPMLSPIILLNLVYTIVDNFTDANNAIMMQITSLTSQNVNKMGLSAAFSWSYFVFIGIILLVLLAIYKKANKSGSK